MRSTPSLRCHSQLTPPRLSQAAGQNCIGAERFIVTSPVYDAFVSTMEPLVRSLVVGPSDPKGGARQPDVGAMVSSRLIPRLEELVAKAVEGGARCLVGGKRFECGQGSFFEPTLLVDVEEWMDLARCVTMFFILILSNAGADSSPQGGDIRADYVRDEGQGPRRRRSARERDALRASRSLPS